MWDDSWTAAGIGLEMYLGRNTVGARLCGLSCANLDTIPSSTSRAPYSSGSREVAEEMKEGLDDYDTTSRAWLAIRPVRQRSSEDHGIAGHHGTIGDAHRYCQDDRIVGC